MQKTLDKLLAFQTALKIYKEMCKDLVCEEFSEYETTYKDIKKMKVKVSKTINNINNDSYLREINKQILKISMLDNTNLETVRKNKKLYLTLSK